MKKLQQEVQCIFSSNMWTLSNLSHKVSLEEEVSTVINYLIFQKSVKKVSGS